MNINSVKFNPSFQKKLMAIGNVVKNNEPCAVSIYKLDKKEDKDYFTKLENTPEWYLSTYLRFIGKDFDKSNLMNFFKNMFLEYYSIEDSYGRCLGMVEVDDNKRKTQNIEYLETFPANRWSRRYRYVGETMLAFLTKQQQMKSNPKQIIVDTPMLDAQPFYLKSYLKYDDETNHTLGMHLPNERVDLLLKQNEEHTGSEIKFVGGKCE